KCISVLSHLAQAGREHFTALRGLIPLKKVRSFQREHECSISPLGGMGLALGVIDVASWPATGFPTSKSDEATQRLYHHYRRSLPVSRCEGGIFQCWIQTALMAPRLAALAA